MPRLLIITATPLARTESYITTQARAFASYGWDVCIAQGGSTGSSILEDRVMTVGFPLEIPGRPMTLPDRVQRALTTLATRNWPAATPGSREACAAVVSGWQPDVILAQFGETAGRLLPLLKALKLPWAVQFHGYDATSLARFWGYRLTVGSILRNAAAVFGCSDFISAEIRRIGRWRPCHAPVVTVSPGYDDRRFRPLERPAKGTGDPLSLISVARLIEGKGHRYVIDALAQCDHRITLRIIGDGQDRDALAARAGELGLSARVRFDGVLHHAEIVDAFAASDVFVQASTTASDGWREGLGLSPIEAAATGLPVIVTDSGGLAETCRNGVTGIVVPDRDVGGLARAINGLAAEPERRAEMGRRGASFAAVTYSASQQAAKADAVLRTFIAS